MSKVLSFEEIREAILQSQVLTPYQLLSLAFVGKDKERFIQLLKEYLKNDTV